MAQIKNEASTKDKKEVEAGSLRKEVVRGTFWSIFGSIAIKFFSFLYTIVIARLFSQQDVGTFYLALSIMYPISIFADLGLNQAFGRYAPYYLGKKEKNNVYALLNTAYVYSGTLSIILGIAIIACAGTIAEFFKNPDLVPAMYSIALFLVFFTFFTLNSSFLISMKKLKESNLLMNLQNVLKLVFTLLFFTFSFGIFGANINSLCMGFLISYLICTIISKKFVDGELKNAEINAVSPTNEKRITLLKEVVPFGLMLSLVSMFWAIATNIDRMLIGYLLPENIATIQIAIYSIALALATLITIFPSAIMSILLPVMSEMDGGGKKKERLDLSYSTVRWTTFLLVPLTILLIAFPQEILNMFYGASYAEGWLVLSILTIGLFIRSISTVHGTILASMRVVYVEVMAALAALIVNVILNVILIPTYGIVGSAIAAMVSFFAVTILLIYYSKKLAGFGLSLEFFRPVVAGILALVVLIILKGQFLQLMQMSFGISGVSPSAEITIKMIKLVIFGILFLISCAVYGLILIFMKAIKKEDWILINAIMKKGKVPKRIVEIAERLGDSQYV